MKNHSKWSDSVNPFLSGHFAPENLESITICSL